MGVESGDLFTPKPEASLPATPKQKSALMLDRGNAVLWNGEEVTITNKVSTSDGFQLTLSNDETMHLDRDDSVDVP